MDAKRIKAERLRAARLKAGYETAEKAAEAFGWKSAGYRHHENETRGFGADAAKRYGKAFKVKPAWLLGLEHANDAPVVQPQEEDELLVNGAVEAGAWRASEEWNDDRTFIIDNMPSPVPGARRFGMVVAGASMNVFYEPGTVLDCVSIFKGGVRPHNGDHVIVECVRPDGLRELTVKEYREEDGRYLLVPHSTDKRFQPMEYPGPDEEHASDAEVHVIAFVMAAYPPRALDLMRRMGMIRPAK